MALVHRDGDTRICKAVTVVEGQTSVFVAGKLWAVLGDPNTHQEGRLINTGQSVFINNKPVIVHTADPATVDNFFHPPSITKTNGSAKSVDVYSSVSPAFIPISYGGADGARFSGTGDGNTPIIETDDSLSSSGTVSGGGGDITGDGAYTEAADTIASEGTVSTTITGDGAYTEAADTIASDASTSISDPVSLISIKDDSGPHDILITGEFTPTDNSLLIGVVHFLTYDTWHGGNDLVAFEDVAENLTWTRRAYNDPSGIFDSAVAIYTAPITTGIAMTISAFWDADVAGSRIEMFEVLGHNISSPIGATAAEEGNSRSGALNVALSATSATNSLVFGAVMNDHNDTTDGSEVTPGTGWTELTEASIFDSLLADVEFIKDVAKTDIEWNEVNSGDTWAVAGIEIKHS